MLRVHETLGYSDIETVMIHTDVLNKGAHGVPSPTGNPPAGSYSLYRPEVSREGEVRKWLVGNMLRKNLGRGGNFLYRKGRSVPPVLYKLDNHR